MTAKLFSTISCNLPAFMKATGGDPALCLGWAQLCHALFQLLHKLREGTCSPPVLIQSASFYRSYRWGPCIVFREGGFSCVMHSCSFHTGCMKTPVLHLVSCNLPASIEATGGHPASSSGWAQLCHALFQLLHKLYEGTVVHCP